MAATMLAKRMARWGVGGAITATRSTPSLATRTIASFAPAWAAGNGPHAPGFHVPTVAASRTSAAATQRRDHVHSATCGCPASGVGGASRSVHSTAPTEIRHTFIGKELVEPKKGHIGELFAYNRKWATEKAEQDPEHFSRLAAGQQPRYLFIGCADSRVAASQILGLGPGEVFVHRNIANMVIGGDLSVQSVIEYGVGHLGVEDIIVCGHYGCGGVHAAASQQDVGVLNFWLGNIREVHRIHREELEAIKDDEARHRRLVELNVGEQCLNLFKLAVIQRHQRERGAPRVHGLVYNIHDGLMKKVPVDFRGYADAYKDVYSLYDMGPDK